MESDDIVARLRRWSLGCGMYDVDIDIRNAADEIERLRAERDQLRAERDQLRAEIVDRALGFCAYVPWNSDSKARMKCEAYAAERGWIGLYDKINKRVAEIEVRDER